MKKTQKESTTETVTLAGQISLDDVLANAAEMSDVNNAIEIVDSAISEAAMSMRVSNLYAKALFALIKDKNVTPDMVAKVINAVYDIARSFSGVAPVKLTNYALNVWNNIDSRDNRQGDYKSSISAVFELVKQGVTVEQISDHVVLSRLLVATI